LLDGDLLDRLKVVRVDGAELPQQIKEADAILLELQPKLNTGHHQLLLGSQSAHGGQDACLFAQVLLRLPHRLTATQPPGQRQLGIRISGLLDFNLKTSAIQIHLILHLL
jgi:protein subunit release factor A